MSNEHRLHNVVYARLEAIIAAETITRKELGELSREALTYVVDTHDIDFINRLITGLKTANKKIATMYFTQFLPWEVKKVDGKFSRFGKMFKKPKQLKKKVLAIGEWLAVEENNIWSWMEDNVEFEQKVINLNTKLDKALENAIYGAETDRTIGEPIPKDEILKTVLKHITEKEMMELLAHFEEEESEQVENPEEQEPEQQEQEGEEMAQAA